MLANEFFVALGAFFFDFHTWAPLMGKWVNNTPIMCEIGAFRQPLTKSKRKPVAFWKRHPSPLLPISAFQEAQYVFAKEVTVL